MNRGVRRRDCKKGWRHFDAERLVCGQSHYYSVLPRAIWVLEQRRSNIPSRLLSLESVLTSIAESHACGCSVFTDCRPLTAKRNLGGPADCCPPLTACCLVSRALSNATTTRGPCPLDCPRRIASRPNPRNAGRCQIRMNRELARGSERSVNRTAASGLNGATARDVQPFRWTSLRQESDEVKVVGDADLDQFIVAHAMDEVGSLEPAA
jgi:hypothetical protein